MTTNESPIDRSYQVRRSIGGTDHDVSGAWRATLREDVRRRNIDEILAGRLDSPVVTYPAGTPVVLRHTSNAGFRGIEGSVTFPDGNRGSVSLGILDIERNA